MCYAVSGTSCSRHLTTAEGAPARSRMAPSGKLPPLSDVVIVTYPRVPLCPQPFPLIHSRALHCSVVWMAIAICLIFWCRTCLIPKLAERHLLPSYLLASSQDQPWCLGYDHSIVSFGFCLLVGLEEHFFMKSNFLWIKTLNDPFYPNIQVPVNHESISTSASGFALPFAWSTVPQICSGCMQLLGLTSTHTPLPQRLALVPLCNVALFTRVTTMNLAFSFPQHYSLSERVLAPYHSLSPLH